MHTHPLTRCTRGVRPRRSAEPPEPAPRPPHADRLPPARKCCPVHRPPRLRRPAWPRITPPGALRGQGRGARPAAPPRSGLRSAPVSSMQHGAQLTPFSVDARNDAGASVVTVSPSIYQEQTQQLKGCVCFINCDVLGGLLLRGFAAAVPGSASAPCPPPPAAVCVGASAGLRVCESAVSSS